MRRSISNSDVSMCVCVCVSAGVRECSLHNYFTALVSLGVTERTFNCDYNMCMHLYVRELSINSEVIVRVGM